MTELNKRQKTFAEAYAIPGTECYGNATKSAIYAGYKESRAEVTGSELVEIVRYKNISRGRRNSLMSK